MKLAAPFIQLPLLFDSTALAAEVQALGEAPWMPHPQGFAGNSMLPLIAVGGDPANESFAGVMRPTPHLQRCRYLQQVLGALGVTLGRTRLMRLSGHAEVTRHADQGYYWADRVRVHVPLVTQPTVRFECGDSHVNMAAGECWIFDTWRQHRVLNDAEESRIHLVADTVGGDRFWNLVGQGRDHNGRPFAGTWTPQTIAPGSNDGMPPLLFESANVPVVMTPWEITSRIGFLFGEANPHPALGPLRQAAAQFCRHWQALWAAYGERSEGWPVYRRAVDSFMQHVNSVAQTVTLQNELLFASVVHTMIGKVAVTGSNASAATPVVAPSAAAAVAAGAAPGAAAPAVHTGARAADPQFERPIFIVSSPRSGSTLLFETLAKAPGIHTIGGESHAVIEGMPELSPARNGLGSNRLTAAEATPAVVQQLRKRFLDALVDRDGKRPNGGRVRMLEKTPKNSLRVPFLDRVFPEGVYVYLHRDAREVMGSMIEAWQSGRFRTYPNLPGWNGTPWSLLLTPGWQALNGRPLGEVVASQWETAMRMLLDDLEALPRERVRTARYDDLVGDPQKEIARLCTAIGVGWDRPIAGALPLAKHTVSQPRKDKWRQHADAIEPQLERLQATIDRAERFAAR